jgi:hypothetical protein
MNGTFGWVMVEKRFPAQIQIYFRKFVVWGQKIYEKGNLMG